jgi:hypothetical protein
MSLSSNSNRPGNSGATFQIGDKVWHKNHKDYYIVVSLQSNSLGKPTIVVKGLNSNGSMGTKEWSAYVHLLEKREWTKLEKILK